MVSSRASAMEIPAIKKNRFAFFTKATTSPALFQFSADVIASFVSILLYVIIRNYLTPDSFSVRARLLDIFGIAVFLTIFWTVILWLFGMYKNWYVRSPFDEYFSIIRNTFIGCSVIFFAVFMDSSTVQRESIKLTIILYWIILSIILCFGRLAARLIQKNLRIRKIITIQTILLGSAKKVLKLYESLLVEVAWGYKISGVILSSPEEVKTWNTIKNSVQLPLLGVFHDVPKVIEHTKPDEALIAIEEPEHEKLLEIVAACDVKNITVKIVPDLYEIFSGQAKTLQIYGSPLIEVNPQLMKPWEEAVKRILDILISMTIMVVSLPVCLMTAIAIKFESKGPVFFTQERVGRNGKVFTLYKFRSMRTDSEKDGPQWTKVNDPRVTRFGRFIRRTHIDEIPQFWNILKGEMSVVGPRPEQPYYVEKFSALLPYYSRRLKVKPGLTGWYQVKYITYVESLDEIKSRLQFDFFYIENISLKLDLEIMVRTVFRVIKGQGQT